MKTLLLILLLSIVMILAVSGILIGIIAIFAVENASPLGMGLLAGFCALIAAGCLKWILHLNRSWMRDLIRKFEVEPDAIIARWSFSRDKWLQLVEHEKEEGHQTSALYGWLSGIIAAIVSAAALFPILGWLAALGSALLVGFAVKLLAEKVFLGRSQRDYRSRVNDQVHEIAIRPDSLLINGHRLAYWNVYGSTLESMTKEAVEGLSFPLFTISIRKATGKSSHTTHVHRVPMPESDGKDLVDTLLNRISTDQTLSER